MTADTLTVVAVPPPADKRVRLDDSTFEFRTDG